MVPLKMVKMTYFILYTYFTRIKRSVKKKNLDTDVIPFPKINSKWSTDLNRKGKTVKLVDYIENLADLEFDSEVLGTTPKEWTMKEKTDKRDLIKIQNFFFEEDIG